MTFVFDSISRPEIKYANSVTERSESVINIIYITYNVVFKA